MKTKVVLNNGLIAIGDIMKAAETAVALTNAVLLRQEEVVERVVGEQTLIFPATSVMYVFLNFTE